MCVAEDSAMVFWLVLVGFLLSAVDVLGFVALQGRERSCADAMSHL
jgi:hypothetical protein